MGVGIRGNEQCAVQGSHLDSVATFRKLHLNRGSSKARHQGSLQSIGIKDSGSLGLMVPGSSDIRIKGSRPQGSKHLDGCEHP